MRILIVDDEPAMHASYARSFAPVRAENAGALDAMAAALFGDDAAGDAESDAPAFTLTRCDQGLDAVAEVERALAEGAPYPVAFIDIRMPPGIDGRETARRIRALDPDINLVIVTGYSDFSPLEIAKVAGPTDKIFYIAKPFEVAEIVQTATALTHRWQADRELRAARETLAAQVKQLEEQGLELAANESRALHLATHDSLTEAPNRLAFLRALGERARKPGLFGTAMLDLDRFKLVNDTLGHLAGDALIREMCAKLQQSSPEGAVVARLGGDEFGVLFDTAGQEAAVMACERMIAACSVTFSVLGNSVRGGASCGLVAVDGRDDRDPLDIVRRADLALNDAKRSGRGVVRLFDDSMDDSIRFRRDVEDRLSQAVQREELSLAYQPIVSRDGLEIDGFEALVRWNTNEFGLISPDTFIPIAEESNLIHELGDWILGAALKELQHWPGQYVSVNFSPRQFRRHNFVGHVMESVQRAGVSPGRVQIEITETAIFDDAERAAETLYKLRQMGFRIALDDFGTGYSSLYNIRKFALDCLKIDRSFIDGMGRERESAAIVHSIIHLGRALGLGVVAEGVETEAQVQALRVAGASHMQGYYFSQAVPPERARALAEQRSMATPPLMASGATR
ncbi:putative bifunctional diguanylate cyclase/phosphodiesterase [Sphingomonas carotinifaciens]|uniref:Diguanylate cyclase (GGDEF) domain-containing protein n=1 Tax=Sphingomonas carotinifaciens TaxID=1166323 RepID=A0A1G7EZZ4_9SPHN|nr:EAL domain-containing protein [Sphingomonas carotinifaciens]MBB4085823.1 diguanylate cyclase (GGDEF)-like protein [Sphingomonas carotinifaciens]MWC45214.1 EAL domain-containing protein [Sphingomonas carotinifaciens]SDE69253.1 diguanylate cyclase (GGDEF) domain-containing protein [Sphingomonas carotinifaciens]